MLRTLRRWFSTGELKQVAKDLDEMIDRHSDFGHKLEGLGLKIERLENKYRMRDARAARAPADTLTSEERDILEDLRSRGGDATHDPFYS